MTPGERHGGDCSGDGAKRARIGRCLLRRAIGFGRGGLFVGTLFYARLTPELGLPALPAERTQALADALKLGPQAAGPRRRLRLPRRLPVARGVRRLGFETSPPGDLDAVGWALMAVSVALAMVFDSMTAALFLPLGARRRLRAVRRGQIVVRLSVRRRQRPLWLGLHRCPVRGHPPRRPAAAAGVSYVGIVIGAAAAISGLGAALGVLHLPLVIGLSVTFGCVILAALGLKIARSGPAGVL